MWIANNYVSSSCAGSTTPRSTSAIRGAPYSKGITAAAATTQLRGGNTARVRTLSAAVTAMEGTRAVVATAPRLAVVAAADI